MSRDPGEGPDEDGEPVDQSQDRPDTEDSAALGPNDETAERDAGAGGDGEAEAAGASDDTEGDTGSAPEGQKATESDDGSDEAGPNGHGEDQEEGDELSDVPSEADVAKEDGPRDGAEDVDAEEGGDGTEERDKAVEGDDIEEEGDGAAETEEAGNGGDEPDQEEETGEAETEDEGEEGDESDQEDNEDETIEAGTAEEGEPGDEESAEGDEEDEADSETADAEEEESDVEKTPIERKTGPAEDEEQPLTDHIEEMVKRVAVVLFIAGIVSLIAFPFGEEFINFLWYSVLPSDISKPHVYHPLELIITQLKAASLLGVVLALPIFVYQTYAFMRPGLYPHERRYYLSAVPTSLVLAFVGLLFGYFLVLPAVMTYFMQYSRDVVDIAFALGETFTLMLILLAFLAVVFQIPLFIMLAIMMGLTTRQWLADRRLIMWGVFLGIAFLFSPDPTGMAPFLIALTMVGLFEGTLALLKWTGRGDG